MNKYNTILGQMLALISRSRFEKQVKEHKTEHGAKGLKSWTQFVTMLFSQLTGQHGLRSSEVKEFKTVIYQFYFGDKDNVVSEVFSY